MISRQGGTGRTRLRSALTARGWAHGENDVLLLEVWLEGPGSCYVGFRSCFYRAVQLSDEPDEILRLTRLEATPAFDARGVYAGLPNPTRV